MDVQFAATLRDPRKSGWITRAIERMVLAAENAPRLGGWGFTVAHDILPSRNLS